MLIEFQGRLIPTRQGPSPTTHILMEWRFAAGSFARCEVWVSYAVPSVQFLERVQHVRRTVLPKDTTKKFSFGCPLRRSGRPPGGPCGHAREGSDGELYHLRCAECTLTSERRK